MIFLVFLQRNALLYTEQNGRYWKNIKKQFLLKIIQIIY